jgi:acyl-CoA thioester hydrolase
MFPMQTKSRRIAHMIANSMPPTPLVTALRVRYVECDMQGHVFNGHYLTYFDLAHTEALRSATGLGYAELVAAHDVDLVVAESGVKYLAPAHFDDLLEIAVTFEPPTTSSLTSRFAITRAAATVATGFLRHVCVDSKTYKKTAWPEAVRSALAPYLGADGAS